MRIDSRRRGDCWMAGVKNVEKTGYFFFELLSSWGDRCGRTETGEDKCR